MKTNKICLCLLFAYLMSSAAFSQDADSTRNFTLSGSIDVYARTALGAENDMIGGYGPSSAFANLKGFSLGMANLIASYNGEKAGFVADLVFGPRGRDAVFAEDGFTGQRIINQMFGYLKLGNSVTLNMGQFNTFLGYEVISPTVNVNTRLPTYFLTGRLPTLVCARTSTLEMAWSENLL